jgi:hypothetical protein
MLNMSVDSTANKSKMAKLDNLLTNSLTVLNEQKQFKTTDGFLRAKILKNLARK